MGNVLDRGKDSTVSINKFRQALKKGVYGWYMPVIRGCASSALTKSVVPDLNIPVKITFIRIYRLY